MNLLALDTSTHACSVALSIDSELFSMYKEAPKKQGDLILPMIRSIMEQARTSWQNIDAIAFGCGPGAFTGLRIGAGVVQGLALAHELPVYPVSCLQALAFRAHHHFGARYIAVAQDARMNEIYAGGFSIVDNNISIIHAEQLVSPESFQLSASIDWCHVGTGWSAYANKFSEHDLSHCNFEHWSMLPRAIEVAQIALLRQAQADPGVPVEKVSLRYLRNKVVATRNK